MKLNFVKLPSCIIVSGFAKTLSNLYWFHIDEGKKSLKEFTFLCRNETASFSSLLPASIGNGPSEENKRLISFHFFRFIWLLFFWCVPSQSLFCFSFHNEKLIMGCIASLPLRTSLLFLAHTSINLIQGWKARAEKCHFSTGWNKWLAWFLD